MSPSISTTKKLMRLGIAITLFWLFIALFSPLLQIIGVLQDPTELLSNMPREAPSISHLLGTDIRGYDVLSRTLIGSQAALKVVFLSTIFSLVIGVPSGLISGYLGGKLDKFLMFLMDTIYTIPGFLLSVTLSFILGKGIVNIAIAVSIAYVPQYYRICLLYTSPSPRD